MKLNMPKEEVLVLFSHAMLSGLAANGHLLKANVSGQEIGKMIREKTESIVEGFTEGDDEDVE